MKYIDGVVYSDDEVVDIGSWKCSEKKVSEVTGKEIRTYAGLSKDVSKLPKYDCLGSGTVAVCIDTGDLYMYEQTEKTWTKQ